MATARFSLLRVLADGKVHSVEELGRSLDLSARELGKTIADLRAMGLSVGGIDSAYRLEERVELYDEDLLERVQRASPSLHLVLVDECPSTNTLLAQRAKAGAVHGSALACEHQSAGRGRRGNAWISSVGGGVTFSVLWRFSQGTRALIGLSLAIAAGVAEALEGLGVSGVAVKWPNDLLCGERKLGGILVETTGEGSGPCSAVVGVGINMRLSAAARERIGRPVTDVEANSAEVPSRTEVLVGLLASIASTLELFSREGFAPFRGAWLARHAWQGRRVLLWHADCKVVEGDVVGVAEDGALEVASERGIERFHSGELSLSLGTVVG